MNKNDFEIAKNLNKLRKAKKFTQEKLAKRATLEKSTIAKMENGTRKISATELAKFATILDVNINAFINREAFFSGSFEEALVEGFSLLSTGQKQIVLETMKLSLYQKNRRAKSEDKKRLKKLRISFANFTFGE